MTALTMRPYAGETDWQAIADLLNACEAVDRLQEAISVSKLRMELDAPSTDKARDIRLWEDATGSLIAFAYLRIPESGETVDGWLIFLVHPAARGGDLERQIVAWSERRMREVAAERGVPVLLRSGARHDQGERIALLEACGFKPERYFFRMARSLDGAIPEPPLPVGFTLRQGSRQDAKAWAEMYDLTFSEHWNHYRVTVEQVREELANPYYRPELDLMAVAPDGTFAALCYCAFNPEWNARSGRNEGWIAILGTRPGFRRMGLGRAMLFQGSHRLKAAGAGTAVLGVDAENPSGAGALYEGAGFRKSHTWIAYGKGV
ncbi:GNAT family N-acetyltransferase [Kamptonema formosum]|uniref:GNAT family N-acetyltransferase n=1 Tax=Kamptonema formosum TaxID=331992 RepID=UPI0003824F93|nr:GNAT family N-acetyltransferase [Oscillatoria sp. PCC 10802]